MEYFCDGQKVRVTNPDGGREALRGWTGTVVRLRRQDDGAFINMDQSLPTELMRFPEGDTRCRHILLYPDVCEEAPTPA